MASQSQEEGAREEVSDKFEPVLLPKIPYVGEIPGGIRPGKVITVSGLVDAGTKRFHINLQCGDKRGSSKKADIALQFNPRFSGILGKTVVRNTLTNDKWQSEEWKSPPFPFKYGKKFEIQIMTEEGGYRILVNGEHFVDFTHRIKQLDRINTIVFSAQGNLKIEEIAFSQQKMLEESDVIIIPPNVVKNPDLPYISGIPGSMRSGKVISIQGHIHDEIERFCINLQCGADLLGKPRTDVALYTSVRFWDNLVVRNTLKSGKWGKEEAKTPRFLFVTGKDFTLIILAEDKCYKIAINGQHFTTYDHRIPMDKVKALSMHCSPRGSMYISSIKFEEGISPTADVEDDPDEITEAIINPKLPYVGFIPGGLYPGKMIFVNGIVNNKPDRFDINFQCGASSKPRADVAFHFNPRFNEGRVICNTMQHEKWQWDDEKCSRFPFQANTNFEIVFLVQQEFFTVSVDGAHLHNYKHRIPYQMVNTLRIKGATRITKLWVE